MSGVAVPTFDQFTALEQRVAALEQGSVTPPNPEPPDPPDPIEPTEGVDPTRIARLIESLGWNTFSSLDTGNSWGSWPADYQPASVVAGLKWIAGDSGHSFPLREYHYKSREAMQRTWFQQIIAQLPDTQSAICIAANGSVQDVPSMIALAADPTCQIKWVEGLCEPNTNFGWGTIPKEQTLEIQLAVYASAPCTVMGPSIVAGTPHPEGWITGYAGDTLPELNENMHWGNGHYYPPHAPDVPNTGYSVNEYIGGLWGAYAQHNIALTEFHPTLYAAATMGAMSPKLAILARMISQAGRWPAGRALPPIGTFSASPRDPFYTLTTLLRCRKNGTMGVWWYALFDYGSTYECGVFPKTGGVDPRPIAYALRNFCQICRDTGDRHNFTCTKLDLTVSALPAGVDFDVYQASDGRHLVPIWYAGADAGQGTEVDVTLTFGSQKAALAVYDPLQSAVPIGDQANASAITLTIKPGVFFVEVYR